VWDGERTLSSEWIAAATSAHANNGRYGYLWWPSPELPLYAAQGRGGQYLFVYPAASLIVVVTANNGPGGRISADQLGMLLLPALTAEATLPANPEAVAALEARVQQAATPPVIEAEPVPPLPDMAGTVDGQIYQMQDNDWGLQTVSLRFLTDDEALLSITADPGAAFGDDAFEWRAGLDNVPRRAAGRYGITSAATGAWVEDNSFEMQVDGIGNNFSWRVRLTFHDDQVTVTMTDTSGFLPPLTFEGAR
jgi:hypothetical protein